jgi:hypothetical protein
MLRRENLARCLSREQLKSTLGISDVTNADYPKNRMQTVHENVSDERSLLSRQNQYDQREKPP